MCDSILKDNRFNVLFAVFVMDGWSLSYPLIKLGYMVALGIHIANQA